MLNLLFISDSAKIENIKKALQPLLKVIIDVVPDFDHGLKDVFEKRPATVCIQDQISGVTGESVARHIQMLLGSGAPSFILIHEGSPKAKQIKGLFEYIVDLNQPDAKLAEEIQSSLKSVTGDQWDKIFIPPKQSAASLIASTALAEESREDADRLVDDFLSDLESGGFSILDEAPPPVVDDSDENNDNTFATHSNADEMAEMLLEQANRVRQDEITAEKLTKGSESSAADIFETLPPPDFPKESAVDTPPKPLQTVSQLSKPSERTESLPIKTVELSKTVENKRETAVPFAVAETQTSQVTPADFLVKQGSEPVEEQIPEDLLQAFEENFRAESDARRRNIIAVFVLLVFVAGGGWFFVTNNPKIISSLKARITTAAKPVQPSVAKPQTPADKPVVPVQKPVQPTVEKPPATIAAPSSPPSFIPREGIDKVYTTRHPGWERYAGKKAEYRIFMADGKLKAVQVLGVKGQLVSESLLKTVLTELAGTPEYQISSKKKNAGFLELRGSIPQKADVLVYKKGAAIRAFVVSLH